MEIKEILDPILKGPATQYKMAKFENLGKLILDILAI